MQRIDLTPWEWSAGDVVRRLLWEAGMARGKAHTPEEVIAKLRQVEMLVGQGKSVAEAVRSIGVTEPTWRN